MSEVARICMSNAVFANREDSTSFQREHELAMTQQLVSRYRSNVLERKLRRARFKDDDIARMKNQHGMCLVLVML